MIFQTLTAAALSADLTTTAAAQDAAKWQGFYAGGRVNMQNLDISPLPFNLDPEINAGIYSGYNHAVAPNFLVGGEIGYDSALDYHVVGPASIELDNNISLRGRGGYAFGNSLLYGTVGYGWSDWNVAAVGASGSAEGFSYGTGLETLLT